MLVPVILSGGSGTRLWPLSREHYPKQLLPLVGEETMLQDTVRRLVGIEDLAAPVVVCSDDTRFLVAEQLRRINVTPTAILLEPIGRNTAPAAAVAALALGEVEGGANALMLLLPADHVIRDVDAFRRAVAIGAEAARAGALVTFGVVPDRAETGYGYIKAGAPSASAEGVRAVERFVEKPDAETARAFFDSGHYLWNSGMFVFRAERYLAELERFAPGLLECCRGAFAGARRDLDFVRLDGEAFTACPKDSIDYAVMEHTEHAAVVPLDAGWSDVGDWSSLWAAKAPDETGNVLVGDVLAEATRDSFVVASHRFVATLGLEHHVVVETADAVLVAAKARAQDVGEMVKRLKAQGRVESLAHRRVHRPWGSYDSIDLGDRFQVKRLTVKPGAELSLQMHHHRAEHWVVVRGTAQVTRGDDVFLLTENQSTYIPLGTSHRLANPGHVELEVIEVQSGAYLGEDDIVRFEDRYQR